MIDFGCPRCGTTLRVAETAVGQKLPCPKCNQRLQVPEPPEMRTMAGVLPGQKPAAGPSGKQWFYQQGDKPCGPLTWAELKNLADTGVLTAEERVWSEGMADWKPAGAVSKLFSKQGPLPAAQGASGSWFEGLGVLVFSLTMGLAFLLFIGYVVWKGVQKANTPVVAAATTESSTDADPPPRPANPPPPAGGHSTPAPGGNPAPAPGGNSTPPAGGNPTPPPAPAEEPPPDSKDGPSGPVDEPQVWEMVQINARGDGMFLRKYLFSASSYRTFSPRTIDKKELLRDLGFRQHWHKIDDFDVKPIDEKSTLEVRWVRRGLASHRANDGELWEADLPEEPGLTLTSRDREGASAILHGKMESTLRGQRFDAPLSRVVRGPRGSTDMQTAAGTTQIRFRMPAARPAPDRPDGAADPKPKIDKGHQHLMACLGQVYSQPRFARWWVARSAFENTTGQTLRDYVVRFQLEGFDAKGKEFRCRTVVPGQVVVDAYFPSMDLEKLVQLTADRPVHLAVEYEYRKADGREVRGRVAVPPFQMHYRNQAIFSNLPRAECLGGSDRFQNAPYFLAALATKDDKLIRDVAKLVTRRVGGAATYTPEGAYKFLEGLHQFMCAYSFKYDTSSTDIFDGKTSSQTVMYGRDVLENKTGTCIDLAIFYASACRAVGLEPLLIVIPGHCFPVVPLPGPLTIPNGDKPITLRLIGVETTMIGDKVSFRQAMVAGTNNFGKHRAEGTILQIVDVCREQNRGIRCLPLPARSLQDIGIRDDDEIWARLKTAPAPSSSSSSGGSTSPLSSRADKTAAVLVGKWQGTGEEKGVPIFVFVTLTDDRRYSLVKRWQERSVLGRGNVTRTQRLHGTYNVDEDSIRFTTADGKSQVFDYRLRDKELSLWTNNAAGGKLHFDLKRGP